MVIIFVAVLFVYLAGGIAFQIFVRKASGKEVIPQSSFWIGCPGLVKACQIQPGSPPAYYPIGFEDSATFSSDPTSGQLALTYTASTDAVRTTIILLNCDPSQDPGQMTAQGEDPNIQATYDLSYTGKYACPRAGPAPPPSGGSGGLSVGSIMVIIFFALSFVYLTGGVAFQIFVKKASGKEAIPQSSLWLSFPGLVKACQIQPGTPKAYFNIGLEGTATFTTDGQDQVTVQYNDQTPTQRTTFVKLMCDPSQDPGTVTALGETSTAKYTLTYQGKYACPSAAPPVTTPSPGPGGPGGISVGSILTIIFFTTLILYVVAGVLLQKFVRKAAGKELIPQYTLWSALPSLIKGGVMFTVKCGKVGKGYDSI